MERQVKRIIGFALFDDGIGPISAEPTRTVSPPRQLFDDGIGPISADELVRHPQNGGSCGDG